MFSLETATLVHKCTDRIEAGAKIALVGKDVSMKVQANNAGTADQRREQMLRAALDPEVAGVRQKFDERWRELICSLVVAGQEAGEFGPVDPVDFAVLMSALLDGLAVQIALADPAVDANRAFELSMRFAAAQLGFTWAPRRDRQGSRARR